MADIIVHTRDCGIQVEIDGQRVSIGGDLIEPPTMDFAVWITLPYAMRTQHDLRIEFITEDCLFHANILQAYLNRFLHLKPIRITAHHFAPAAKLPTKLKFLLPFSGGIDSCFSLLYANKVLNRTIDTAMHVLGLDLMNENEYEGSTRRCRAILEITGTELLCVRTDVRMSVARHMDWRLYSDFVLSGLLHLFEATYSRGFISGGGDGIDLTIRECFQAPFLHEHLFHLFSNQFMQIDPFEQGHNRIQKIAFVADYPVALNNLRVCWKQKKHGNCGKCSKCIITQLALIASIGYIPPSFPFHLNEGDLGRLLWRAKNRASKDPDHDAVLLPRRCAQILEIAKLRGHSHRLFASVRRFMESVD